MLPGDIQRRSNFAQLHTTLLTYGAPHLPHNIGKAIRDLGGPALEAAFAKPAASLRRRATEIICTLMVPAHRILQECAVQYQSLLQTMRRVVRGSTALPAFNASVSAAARSNAAKRIIENSRSSTFLQSGQTWNNACYGDLKEDIRPVPRCSTATSRSGRDEPRS